MTEKYSFKIKTGLYAEIGKYKSGSKSTEAERRAVAYLFKVRKDLFCRKYEGFYVLYGGPCNMDYWLKLYFKLPL